MGRGPGGGGGPVAVASQSTHAVARPMGSAQPQSAPVAQAAPAPAAVPAGEELSPLPHDFRALVQLFSDRREGALYGYLMETVQLVRMEPGRLELKLRPAAPPTLPAKVGQFLTEWTGQRWIVALSEGHAQPTLAEQDQAEKNRAWAEAEANPVVRAVKEAFSGAKIIDVRDLAEVAAAESAVVADDGETPDFMVQQQDDGVYYPLDDEGEY